MYQSRFPSLGAAGKRRAEVGAQGPAWGQAALEHAVSHRCIPVLHPTAHPTATAPARDGGEPGREGCPYLVSSSLSFSVSCLSSSFSPSFSFSFSFSSFSSWLLRGICCCCCKTRDVKQNNPSVPRRIHHSTWANLNKRVETMLGSERPRGKALQAEGTGRALTEATGPKAFRGDQR